MRYWSFFHILKINEISKNRFQLKYFWGRDVVEYVKIAPLFWWEEKRVSWKMFIKHYFLISQNFMFCCFGFTHLNFRCILKFNIFKQTCVWYWYFMIYCIIIIVITYFIFLWKVLLITNKYLVGMNCCFFQKSKLCRRWKLKIIPWIRQKNYPSWSIIRTMCKLRKKLKKIQNSCIYNRHILLSKGQKQ